MISLEASPRSPRVVAEQMMRRAQETGDVDMWNRGKRAMQYAEDAERRRPSKVHAQVEHDRFEAGGPVMRSISEAGQIFGLTVVCLYFSTLYFGLFPTAVVFVALCLAGLAGFVAYRTIKGARQ